MPGYLGRTTSGHWESCFIPSLRLLFCKGCKRFQDLLGQVWCDRASFYEFSEAEDVNECDKSFFVHLCDSEPNVKLYRGPVVRAQDDPYLACNVCCKERRRVRLEI